MRLLDLAAPAQEILLGDEGEAIDPAAEAIELDAELDLRRCNRLVVAIGVNPEFRLHPVFEDRHLRSEEHTSELQSPMRISYAVFCLKKNTNTNTNTPLELTDRTNQIRNA